MSQATTKVRRNPVSPNPPSRRMLTVTNDTHAKLKKLAAKEDTSMSEIVRYLVELADEGKVKIR